jgi:TetR/AcrR family transcriptional repressor of nem operon
MTIVSVDAPSMMTYVIVVKGTPSSGGEKARPMRLTKQQAAMNRQAILDAAGRLFRTRGFDAVSVADLMDAAGFTHGGFYNHFPSKEALAREVTSTSLKRSNEAVPRGPNSGAKGKTLAGYIDGYLSPRHRDDPSGGCTIAALAGDASRQGKEVQATFGEGIDAFVEIIAAQLLEGTGEGAPAKGKRAEAAARAEAMRVVSEMVGSLVLSRAIATADPALSDAILAASRRGCVAALRGTPIDT